MTRDELIDEQNSIDAELDLATSELIDMENAGEIGTLEYEDLCELINDLTNDSLRIEQELLDMDS